MPEATAPRSLARRLAEAARATGAALGLVVGLTLAGGPGAATADPLIRYSFDDGRVDAEPPSFGVFEHARGRVLLDSTYRVSGHSAVLVRDRAGDGAVPALHAQFPGRREGTLQVHFAILVADPSQPLRVKLAGPSGFGLAPNGAAFWLEARDGDLVHISEGTPHALLRLEAFRWYHFDLAYDVTRGRYDLSVREEGRRTPVVLARNQANAPGRPGSVVDRLSFASEGGADTSDVLYWIDDVAIDADELYGSEPVVAVGRRRLFFERWHEAALRLDGQLRCPPLWTPADIGYDRLGARRLLVDGRLDDVLRLAEGSRSPPEPGYDYGIVDATAAWSQGCEALERGQAQHALERFEQANGLVSRAPLFVLSGLLAEAALGRWDAVDRRSVALFESLRGDVRFQAALGRVGVARGDLDDVDRWLEDPALDLADPVHRVAADRLFYALLFADRHEEAERYSRGMARRTRDALWSERTADAMAYAGDFEDALVAYRSLEIHHGLRASALLKLGDVQFALGDLEAERSNRARVFESLFSGR